MRPLPTAQLAHKLPPARPIPTPRAEPAQQVGMRRHVGPPAHRLSGSTFLGHVGPCCQLGLLRRSSPNMSRASRGIRSCSLWEPTQDIYPTYGAFSLDYPSGRPRNHHHRVRRAVRSENRGRRVSPLVIFAHIGESPLGLRSGASPICVGALAKSSDSLC